MKEFYIEELTPCDVCGSRNVFLVKNNRNIFQVRCKDCKAKTAWGKKVDVVIQWLKK